ncbi:hypothetical protein EDD66_10569 [Mobilisporobacter senegalensis]|uniref:Uncharacterized protein n=1 Tax=Mobilisporobacter senegalensis TaxID=1329262 RepID=A0A3N1XPN9_9FIRM|nr:hypothetical protein [Mobilisporobacter senegalensis]ROR28131.1 hypothetical protein EDD66_10569 [Mobilisporobacter senegalensis]
MDIKGFVYRCTKDCPWKKHCFVIKTPYELKEEMPVIYKCKGTGNEILIHIGLNIGGGTHYN